MIGVMNNGGLGIAWRRNRGGEQEGKLWRRGGGGGRS